MHQKFWIIFTHQTSLSCLRSVLYTVFIKVCLIKDLWCLAAWIDHLDRSFPLITLNYSKNGWKQSFVQWKKHVWIRCNAAALSKLSCFSYFRLFSLHISMNNHFQFLQPFKIKHKRFKSERKVVSPHDPCRFWWFVCLRTADARTSGSKRRCLWGGQSSKGSGEMQWRKRTSDLAYWGRGSRGRYNLLLLLYFCLSFRLCLFFCL